jgi:hypothetical protein
MERQDKLLQLIQEAIKQDNELRLTLHIGDKFRFIRDRLNALLLHLEKNALSLSLAVKGSQSHIEQMKENETIVYVYLFNAHGLTLTTWQNMLKPELFYEYSINRPVYLEKTQIESFIRSKTNKAQHGYISVVVQKEHVLKGTNLVKDVIASPVVKVKEGALHFENLVSFTHAGKDYLVNANAELIKKE